MGTIYFADFGAGELALMIPFLIFMIPIIAILTKHQQKMAEIMRHNSIAPQLDVQSLRKEIEELRSLVHQQAIELDDLGRLRQLTPPKPPAATNDLESRLGS